jgi:hypothetical protein
MWPRKASKYETLLASWPNKTLQMVTEPSWWIHTADPKLETLHFTRIPSWPSIAACTKSTSTPLHVRNFYYYIYLELSSPHWNSRRVSRALYCSCLWRPTHQILSWTANSSPLPLFCLKLFIILLLCLL